MFSTLDAFGIRTSCRPRLMFSDAGAGAGGGDGGAAAAAAAAPTPAAAAAAAATNVGAAANGSTDAAAQAGAQSGATDGAMPEGFATWPQTAQDAFTKAKADAVRFQREAGDSRINAKAKAAEDARTDLLALLTKTLDPSAADGTATVESVTAALTQTNADKAASDRELAAVKAAVVAGVDPTKLDYLQFQLSRDTAYQALDPKDAELGAKLGTIIASKIASDATLKLTGSAAASGVESHGGASNSTAITPEAFAAMNIAQRQTLYLNDKAEYDRLVAAQ